MEANDAGLEELIREVEDSYATMTEAERSEFDSFLDADLDDIAPAEASSFLDPTFIENPDIPDPIDYTINEQNPDLVPQDATMMDESTESSLIYDVTPENLSDATRAQYGIYDNNDNFDIQLDEEGRATYIPKKQDMPSFPDVSAIEEPVGEMDISHLKEAEKMEPQHQQQPQQATTTTTITSAADYLNETKALVNYFLRQ